MSRIVATFFMSLDGVVESPHEWQFPYFNDQMGAAMDRGLEAATGFLMGRVLYEQRAAYWPRRGGELPGPPGEPGQAADAFASFINSVPKYVVSNTLAEATWTNTTIISGDVAARIKELKDGSEGVIATSGSATLVRWLLARGLLDELSPLVHPIVVGHGQRLFEDGSTQPLLLVSHEVFSTGVLALAYERAGAQPSGAPVRPWASP
jgi:dihydrofolate reductase